jgi:hypothetical protein
MTGQDGGSRGPGMVKAVGCLRNWGVEVRRVPLGGIGGIWGETLGMPLVIRPEKWGRVFTYRD